MRIRKFRLLYAVPLLLAILAPLPASAAPGDLGVFSTKCAYSHANSDDPILYPNEQGRAHRHEFFGNVTTNYKTGTGKLERNATNCDRTADKSAYWVPAMYDNGVELPFTAAHVYYRNGDTMDKDKTVPFPRGLRMIAGTSAHPEAPEGKRTAQWSCQGNDRLVWDDLPDSCATMKVIATITFPSCWDGKNLTAIDQSHMAYPWENPVNPRRCPATHPVQLPELTEWIRYAPGKADMTGLTLASGDGNTIHGDFWNAWEETEQQRLVDDCLKSGIICGTVTDGAPF